jgi:hypothetical protein
MRPYLISAVALVSASLAFNGTALAGVTLKKSPGTAFTNSTGTSVDDIHFEFEKAYAVTALNLVTADSGWTATPFKPGTVNASQMTFSGPVIGPGTPPAGLRSLRVSSASNTAITIATWWWTFGGQQVGNERTDVPEPAVWIMLVGGFGAVGYAIRRRKQAPARFPRRPPAMA